MVRPMTENEMIEWFKAAPMGSRQQRMSWSAHKIARLTGATDGGAYRALESAVIEAETGAAQTIRVQHYYLHRNNKRCL